MRTVINLSCVSIRIKLNFARSIPLFYGGDDGCQTQSKDAANARVPEALSASLQFDLHFLGPSFVGSLKRPGVYAPYPPKMRAVINLSVSEIFRGDFQEVGRRSTVRSSHSKPISLRPPLGFARNADAHASALGQKPICRQVHAMSALPPKKRTSSFRKQTKGPLSHGATHGL